MSIAVPVICLLFAVLWVAVSLVLLHSFRETMPDEFDWRLQLFCVLWPVAVPFIWLHDLWLQRKRRVS